MFDHLPHECILLILGFVLEKPVFLNPQNEFERKIQYGKDWKKKLAKSEIRPRCEFATLISGTWKPPPFTRVLPLTMLSKEMNNVFDINEVWVYLYEQEFRKGRTYKRQPKEAKKLMVDKSKNVLRDRYTPIMNYEREQVEKALPIIKQSMKQIHTIDTALSQIKPQLGSEEYLDDDEKMDRLPVILSPVIHLPVGYVTSWGNTMLYSTRQTLETAACDRSFHRRQGMFWIKNKKESKDKIEKIEKILGKM